MGSSSTTNIVASGIDASAGLDPTVTWGKGERRPWNAELKVLCWKLGDSFVKVSNKEGALYGRIYRERKALGRSLAPRVLQAIGEGNIDKAVFSFIPNTAEAAYMGLLEEIEHIIGRRREQGGHQPSRPAGADRDEIARRDNTAAEVTGDWKESVYTKSYVGAGYIHDDRQGRGAKSVTFRAELPQLLGALQVTIAATAGGTCIALALGATVGRALLDTTDRGQQPCHSVRHHASGVLRTVCLYRPGAGSGVDWCAGRRQCDHSKLSQGEGRCC